MKTLNRISLLILALVGPGVVGSVFAPPPPPPPPAVGAPIDTFVGLLLVVAIAFGMKYLIGKGK